MGPSVRTGLRPGIMAARTKNKAPAAPPQKALTRAIGTAKAALSSAAKRAEEMAEGHVKATADRPSVREFKKAFDAVTDEVKKRTRRIPPAERDAMQRAGKIVAAIEKRGIQGELALREENGVFVADLTLSLSSLERLLGIPAAK
jgi:hypothetical protein